MEDMWLRLRSKPPTGKKMLSSGLDENWQPAPTCSSCVKLKPGHTETVVTLCWSSVRLIGLDCLSNLRRQRCLETRGSRSADAGRRRGGVPRGRGRRSPASAPSCRSLRSGSNSERCPGILCWDEGEDQGEEKIEARLDQLPPASMARARLRLGVALGLRRVYICAPAVKNARQPRSECATFVPIASVCIRDWTAEVGDNGNASCSQSAFYATPRPRRGYGDVHAQLGTGKTVFKALGKRPRSDSRAC